MSEHTCRSCENKFAEHDLTSVHTTEEDCMVCNFGEDGEDHAMQWICQDCNDTEADDNLTKTNLQRDIDRGNGDLSDDSGDDE